MTHKKSIANHPRPLVEDIKTSRLDLIAITPEAIQCEMQGGDNFKHRFNTLLHAEVTSEWPPEEWEPHVLDFLLKQIADDPRTIGWTRFVTLRDAAQLTTQRTLIGTVGGIPPASEMAHAAPTEIEIGYGILPAFRRQGYASEALDAMLQWLLSQAKVSAFVAQTFPHLQPSIRVLEKNGFGLVGAGFEEGTVLFRKAVPDSPFPLAQPA